MNSKRRKTLAAVLGLLTPAGVGKTPQKPFSGQLMVRVDPAVHARAALAAELAGMSLAKWTEAALDRVAGRTLGT